MKRSDLRKIIREEIQEAFADDYYDDDDYDKKNPSSASFNYELLLKIKMTDDKRSEFELKIMDAFDRYGGDSGDDVDLDRGITIKNNRVIIDIDVEPIGRFDGDKVERQLKKNLRPYGSLRGGWDYQYE